MIWAWRNEYFSNFWVWVLEKWVWMFEKEEADLEKEERTRKLQKVERTRKLEKVESRYTWIFMFTSVLPHLELEY